MNFPKPKISLGGFVEKTLGAVTNTATSILNTSAGQQAATAAINKWIGPTTGPNPPYEGNNKPSGSDDMSSDYTKTDNISNNQNVKNQQKMTDSSKKSMWTWIAIAGGILVLVLVLLFSRKKKSSKRSSYMK